jgi:hypothetical protein
MAGSEAGASVDAVSVPVPSPRFTVPAGKLEDSLVWNVIFLIEGSRVLATIALWEASGRSAPGGRPKTFPIRALLVAMVLCALTDQPMLATRFTDVLFRQISPTMRHALGVPKPPDSDDRRGRDNCYRNVRTRFHTLLESMDPSPTPKNRRLIPEAFDALLELRRSRHTEGEWAERQERLTWFVNEILELSIRTLPREVRRHWKGSAAVDDTVIPAFARPSRREKRKKKGVRPKTLRHSSDPDADWYHRDKQEGPDRDPEAKLSVWGYEACLVVSGSDDPDEPSAMPTLVLGMAPLRKPGTQVGQSAIVALTNIAARGHPAHYLAGDRAYSQAKAEHFQLPARALGYMPVLDYKVDQLGRQGSYAGMVLVDGTWYSPGMPESLINATLELRKGVIDEATHAARIAERRNYQMRPKGRPDADGHVRMVCPAAGPAPRVRCALKPKSEGGDGQVRTRIPVTDVLALNQPKVCTQQSITVPPDAGAKYAQELPHESPEWDAMYATLRNSNEGMNGFIKDGAREAVDDPERRRIRGVAAQSVLVALQLFAANMRKIDEFLTKRETEGQKVRKLPSRRMTKSLTTWAPQPAPGVAASKDGSGDPDPPLTA